MADPHEPTDLRATVTGDSLPIKLVMYFVYMCIVDRVTVQFSQTILNFPSYFCLSRIGLRDYEPLDDFLQNASMLYIRYVQLTINTLKIGD